MCFFGIYGNSFSICFFKRGENLSCEARPRVNTCKRNSFARHRMSVYTSCDLISHSIQQDWFYSFNSTHSVSIRYACFRIQSISQRKCTGIKGLVNTRTGGGGFGGSFGADGGGGCGGGSSSSSSSSSNIVVVVVVVEAVAATLVSELCNNNNSR